MELTVQQLTPDFCVAPQLTPEAMAEQIRAAAEAAGLTYHHLPVQGGYQSPEEIAAMRALLDDVPKPVLAFCRSGARSTRLFAAATQL